MKIDYIKSVFFKRTDWMGCIFTRERENGGQELILDLISRSLCGGAFPISAKFELQSPLNPPERFDQKLRINC
jgi:hypothetical protein